MPSARTCSICIEKLADILTRECIFDILFLAKSNGGIEMAIKEKFEWIRSWSDYAPNEDKPRVLLIGEIGRASCRERV